MDKDLIIDFMPKLTPSGVVVLYFMYHFRNYSPSKKMIAKMTGLNRKTIQRAIKELEYFGLVKYREDGKYVIRDPRTS